MKVFQLSQSQILPIGLDEAWAFFSDPCNLAKITPPELNLVPDSSVPEAMHPGMVVTYRVKIAPAIATAWVTEITHVDAPNFFVDEQRFGPYKFWHHLHRFRPCEGGVVAEDLIHYGLYGGPLAGLVNGLVVRRQLEGVFNYRERVMIDLFGASSIQTEAP